ncbi:acyl-CoA/acyl-ACP dehydrogenase [Peribacillus frigoritolerans]|uniref:acyl-CoA dehydrogenase family protein n=1 Tax=Peribacillus frigoritolerans TaxID=450367 RepID=UPI0021D0C694|nr:acyl-CoA dehydrogenase family protein [Peribacillus frigoritolerans]MCU6598977.1 acyl-CoA/acyl-ACP dehydrogenase [Peribacillus frigoritolerans]
MNEISLMIKDTAEKIMKDLCTKETINDAEHGVWTKELWETLKETGMLTIGVSEESGGNGGSYSDALSVLHLAGKYSAPVPLAETFLANWILLDAHLPIAEEATTVAPVNEDDCITFTKMKNGWALSGKAYNVPWARDATSIVVIGDSEQGKAVAIVNACTCNIIHGQNVAGEPRDHVHFEEVYVKETAVSLIEVGKVANIWYTGALIRAVQMSGAIERILEQTIAYSKEREQFGRPIARFQAVQQQIAILAGEVAAAKTISDLAINAFNADDAYTKIAAAKIRVGEAVGNGVSIAHQVHGAIGFTDEHTLQHSTRRLWSWRDEFGTESYWANLLGAEVINKGADQLWPFITSMTGKVV